MGPNEVIKHMQDGWNLRGDKPEIAARLPEPWDVWLQKGVKIIKVAPGVMEVLLRKKRIEEAPLEEHQQAWMAQFRIPLRSHGLSPIGAVETST